MTSEQLSETGTAVYLRPYHMTYKTDSGFRGLCDPAWALEGHSRSVEIGDRNLFITQRTCWCNWWSSLLAVGLPLIYAQLSNSLFVFAFVFGCFEVQHRRLCGRCGETLCVQTHPTYV